VIDRLGPLRFDVPLEESEGNPVSREVGEDEPVLFDWFQRLVQIEMSRRQRRRSPERRRPTGRRRTNRARDHRGRRVGAKVDRAGSQHGPGSDRVQIATDNERDPTWTPAD